MQFNINPYKRAILSISDVACQLTFKFGSVINFLVYAKSLTDNLKKLCKRRTLTLITDKGNPQFIRGLNVARTHKHQNTAKITNDSWDGIHKSTALSPFLCVKNLLLLLRQRRQLLVNLKEGRTHDCYHQKLEVN